MVVQAGRAERTWGSRAEAELRRRPLIVDALVALALLLVVGSLSLSAIQELVIPAAQLTALVVALVVLHGCVVTRRRWPVTSYGLACAAMLVVVALPDVQASQPETGIAQDVPLLVMPSCLLYAVLLASVSARSAARESMVALAVGVVGIALAMIRFSGAELGQTASTRWVLPTLAAVMLALVLASWFIGRLLAARWRAEESDRQRAIEHAVTEERVEIAREVHDSVAHALAVIVRQAEAGQYVAGSAPDKAADCLRVVADVGRNALGDMRNVLGMLRDRAPDSRGGAELAAFPGLVAWMEGAGLHVELDVSGPEQSVSHAVEATVYRVVQEGLTNALKHAGRGAHVRVSIRWSSAAVEVHVVDDGAGRPDPVPGASLGLVGLHERVEALGGTLECRHLNDAGFGLAVRVPLEGKVNESDTRRRR